MTNPREEPSGFHTVHPERDLESNWEVDLANRLEEYLLKICSGEVPEDGQAPINFAEGYFSSLCIPVFLIYNFFLV